MNQFDVSSDSAGYTEDMAHSVLAVEYPELGDHDVFAHAMEM
jgi:hypothetical protein